MKKILNLIEPLRGLAFPELCQVCGESWAGAADGFACRKCRTQVFKTSPPWCEQCGLPFDGTTEESITCKNCNEADWQFARARSMMSARGLVREACMPAGFFVLRQTDSSRNQHPNPPPYFGVMGKSAMVGRPPPCSHSCFGI
ncbi:MAG: double zinc ribbon domain-containing protein [Limisphaerales bacterium]